MSANQFLNALVINDKEEATASFASLLSSKISDTLDVRKVEIASNILDDIQEQKVVNEGEGMDAQRKWVRQVAGVIGTKKYPGGKKQSMPREQLKDRARSYFRSRKPHGAEFVAAGAAAVRDARKSHKLRSEEDAAGIMSEDTQDIEVHLHRGTKGTNKFPAENPVRARQRAESLAWLHSTNYTQKNNIIHVHADEYYNRTNKKKVAEETVNETIRAGFSAEPNEKLAKRYDKKNYHEVFHKGKIIGSVHKDKHDGSWHGLHHKTKFDDYNATRTAIFLRNKRQAVNFVIDTHREENLWNEETVNEVSKKTRLSAYIGRYSREARGETSPGIQQSHDTLRLIKIRDGARAMRGAIRRGNVVTNSRGFSRGRYATNFERLEKVNEVLGPRTHVIVSDSEEGFWHNKMGWVPEKEFASKFHPDEFGPKGTSSLPMSSKNDAKLVHMDKVKDIIGEGVTAPMPTNPQLNRNVLANIRKAVQTLKISGVNPAMAAASHRDFGKLVAKNPKAKGYMLLRKLAPNKAALMQQLTQAGVPMGGALEAHPNEFNQAIQRIKRFR